MSYLKLPPIPQNPISNTFEWREWLYRVSVLLKQQIVNTYTALDFTGSSIISIVNRHHNDLQLLQGGAGGDYNHLTTAQVTAVSSLGSMSTQSSSNVTITGGTVSAGVSLLNTTATTVGAAGTASAVPSLPSGYVIVSIGGTNYKLPYYGV